MASGEPRRATERAKRAEEFFEASETTPRLPPHRRRPLGFLHPDSASGYNEGPFAPRREAEGGASEASGVLRRASGSRTARPSCSNWGLLVARILGRHDRRRPLGFLRSRKTPPTRLPPIPRSLPACGRRSLGWGGGLRPPPPPSDRRSQERIGSLKASDRFSAERAKRAIAENRSVDFQRAVARCCEKASEASDRSVSKPAFEKRVL